MAIAWPSDLPQTYNKDDFTYTKQSGTIRTDMDSGPPKVRRRFTAVSTFYTLSMIMTKTQFDSFETFFESTLKFGTLQFYAIDPLDVESVMEARFMVGSDTPYAVSPDGDSLDFIISFQLEKLP